MTKKDKKPSLRSRLRDDAAIELDALVYAADKALTKIAYPAGIPVIDLAKMIGSSQIDSLQKTLITKLADRKEAALEKIYNEQQGNDDG